MLLLLTMTRRPVSSRSWWLAGAVASALVPGCSADPDSRADAHAETADASSADAFVDPAAPIVLSFGASATAITEGQSVTFSAVVTDPDGVDDVVGGALLSLDEVTTYGAFATAADEGAYSLALSWRDLDAATPIDFDLEENLTLVAVFFDQAGHRAERSAPLRLHCDGDAACDGVCTDLQRDPDSCGACGMQCGEPCDLGRCHGRAPCFAVPASTTCSAHCAALGGACMPTGCGPAALVYAAEDECLASAPVGYVAIEACDAEVWSGSDAWATCCCTP